MLRFVLGLSLLALSAITGCEANGDSSDALSRHTVHVWEIDRDATRQAAVAFMMERTPPEAQDQLASYTSGEEAVPMVLGDAYLEVISDGTYRWHSTVGDDHFVSEGKWTHHRTRSGARIYLQPDEAALADENVEQGIDEWMLLVDTDEMQLRIIVPGYPGPVMRRVD